MIFTPDKTKFKNSKGQYILQGLFYEMGTLSDNQYVQYTLKDTDYLGYPSLYQCYMSLDDPTEYTFATQFLGGWIHFQKLVASSFFPEYVTRWREEMEIKLQSKALAHLITESNDPDSRHCYNANKLLLDKGWKDKKTPVTRTAKEKIKEEAHRLQSTSATIEDDYETFIQNNPQKVN